MVAANRNDLLQRRTMARLIMIRHGESVANLERRFTVDAEEPLTPAGVDQARVRGLALRGSYAPTALYSSPFLRALQTARAIGEVLGLAPVVIDDLREQDFGIYRGRPYTDFYGHWMAAGGIERWDLRPEGGEMLREVARRAGAALDRIARSHLGGEVVVVSHGGVMSALRGWVLDDYSQPPVATVNAGGYLLRFTGERYEGPLDLEPPVEGSVSAATHSP
jgi:probable phosphoglycerate mutase